METNYNKIFFLLLIQILFLNEKCDELNEKCDELDQKCYVYASSVYNYYC